MNPTDSSPALPSAKSHLRQAAQARRAALDGRSERSARIIKQLLALPEFAVAKRVLFYVAVRSEVETHAALLAGFAAGKLVSVPYCLDGRLKLVRLENAAELQLGAYRIPEPSIELREQPERRVLPAGVDLVIVPGIAFDREGNRIGHGAGYYDKLLAEVNSSTTLVGLAYDCQMVDRIPSEPHDVRMHYVITESEVIPTRLRTLTN
jgi:5-formyltetrahydrofolate cyclo-ligase